MAQSLKLKKYVTFKGKLSCKTGMRIGGSKEELEIGGVDNPIIRDPTDKLPYIPGSSLKGKLRSLLEYKYDRIGPNGSPCGCARADCPVCCLFGPHTGGLRGEERREAEERQKRLGPTRIIVRDALISDKSRDKLEAK